MAKIQLNDPGNNVNSSVRRTKSKKTLTDRLIDSGLVKTKEQANLLFIAVIVVGFLLIIYINIQTFSTPAVVDDAFLESDEMLMQ